MQRDGAGPDSSSSVRPPPCGLLPAASAALRITCWPWHPPKLGPNGNDRISEKREPARIPAAQMREIQKQMMAT